MHGSRRWLEAGVLALLGVAIVLNFAQPLHSTLKDLRRGEGFSYALGYPSRDLPTAEECLRLGRQVLGQAEPTIELPTGQAFACRLRLPAPLRVREKAS